MHTAEPIVSQRSTVLAGLPASLAAWTLGFAAVAYLGLEGGGYDPLGRSQLGLAMWWFVILAAVLGIIPAQSGRAALTAITILTGLAAWVALSLTWTDSVERTVVELGRASTYVAVLVVALGALLTQSRAALVAGVAAGIGVIAIVGVLSRMLPEAIGATTLADFLPQTANRLSYPVTYWNSLAALCAIGAPLLLHFATEAKLLITRALAAGAVPAIALCAFLTSSRGGVVAAVVTIGVYLVAGSSRLRKVPTFLTCAIGGGLLVAAASQRSAVVEGLRDGVAVDQGKELLVAGLLVCVGVALVQMGIGLALTRGPAFLRVAPGRRSTAIAAIGIFFVAITVAVAAGVPAEVSDRWEEFKRPPAAQVGADSSSNPLSERLSSANGKGRYQFWESAVQAVKTDPLKGIGPGTFEFWWNREGTLPDRVRDAHSLYLETLAESGIIGLALLLSFFGGVLVTGARGLLRQTSASRDVTAAALAGLCGFLTSSAYDWTWEVAVLPVVALMLCAVVLTPARDRTRSPGAAPPPGRPARYTLVALGVLGIAAIVPSLVATAGVQDSQASARAGALNDAVRQARETRDAVPFSASAETQLALVFEQAGALEPAAAAARRATAADPANWRGWIVRARIEAELGRSEAAVRAYKRARALNPNSTAVPADGD